MTNEQREAIEQLQDAKARKRETAANKLARKPCPQEAGPKLLEAFEAELEDWRTWRAKAAQAWALARNPYPPALDRMLELAGDDLGGSAVNDSVGSAAVAAGWDDPGPNAVLTELLGDDDEVPTERIAAVVGGLRVVPEDDPPAFDDDLAERLITIAEEDPPKTVPHGTHRRLRVFHLRHCLLDVAKALSPDHRARLIAVAEETEYDPNYEPDFAPALEAARQLDG